VPSARDRVLDAYETLLIEAGPAAATLDAVAAGAGVSKGGLLYHFASKDALGAGLLDRLRERSAADADALAALRERLGDPVLAWLVQLVGDGLYLRTLVETPLPEGLTVDDLLTLLLGPRLPQPGG
jgi:AcrR family transcriptional regulator